MFPNIIWYRDFTFHEGFICATINDIKNIRTRSHKQKRWMSLRTIWISSSRNIAMLSWMIQLSLDRQHSRQSSFFLYLPVNNVLHRTNANCNDGGSKHRFFLQSEWFSWFWNDDFRAFLVFDSYTFIFILNYPFGGIVFSVDSGPIGDWTLDLTGTWTGLYRLPLYTTLVKISTTMISDLV